MCFSRYSVYDRVYCVYQQQFYAVVYSEDDCAKVFRLMYMHIGVGMNKNELLENASWIEKDFNTAGACRGLRKIKSVIWELRLVLYLLLTFVVLLKLKIVWVCMYMRCYLDRLSKNVSS